MQTRYRNPRKSRRSKGDLLDQKWLTYLLVLILIALIGIFVASLRYQDALVRYAKDFVQQAKDAVSASLGLKAMPREIENGGIVDRLTVLPDTASPKPYRFSPLDFLLH
ncbi:MAG: hypothetical protein OXN17_06225 [Candidatus Poribacteria bacterium]|nr:hypothetical protein [Candidatus Poribacteria bacterium]MDE0506975.1 hypothetical protein [Candidatus Poribacteria bacterium]